MFQDAELCYLDNAGAALPLQGVIQAHCEVLCKQPICNPHTVRPDQKTSHDSFDIDSIRERVLSFFHTTTTEYSLVFTSGATHSLKLVAEYFSYDEGMFVYLNDNHTSVVGMREYARSRGVSVRCVMESDVEKTRETDKTENLSDGNRGLFVYPGQSNFSGKKYPLSWIQRVKQKEVEFTGSCSKWYTVVDMSSYVSTSSLDLSNSQIDFIPISFYKIFGYPTGLGALLIKNTALHTLSKTYFGGGTVEAVGIKQFFHVPRHNPVDWLEDGTLPYQQISALTYCLNYVDHLPDKLFVQEHTFHLSHLTFNLMSELIHDNGVKLCEIYSNNDYTDSSLQGPIINFNLKSKTDSYIGFGEVGRLASLSNITLRTGCCCNVGACISWLNLTDDDTLSFHQAGHKCGGGIDIIDGRPTGSVRISFGHHNTDSDMNRFISFLNTNFIISTSQNFTANQLSSGEEEDIKISDIFIYPVKSCAAVQMSNCKVTCTGFLYDRTWSIIKPTGQCITQKLNTQICRIKPEITQNSLLLHADGFDSVSVPLNPKCDESNTHSLQTCSMKICGKRRVVLDCGDNVANWLSEVLLVKCRLVRQQITRENDDDMTSLANDSQYLMITKPSLIKLNNYILNEMNTQSNVDDLLRRFRPNIVLDGCEAGSENNWTSINLSNNTFTCMGACERCYMISINQKSGEKSAEPLRSLKQIQNTNKPTFGIHLRYDSKRLDGDLTLSVGDLVIPNLTF